MITPNSFQPVALGGPDTAAKKSRKAGGGQQEYYQVTLENVLISSY